MSRSTDRIGAAKAYVLGCSVPADSCEKFARALGCQYPIRCAAFAVRLDRLDKSITNESYNNDSYNFIIDDNSSKTIDQNLDKMYLSQLLVMLEPKEQKVLTELYLNDQTQEKIANEFNVSQSYISRIKSHSLKKMHKLINNDNLLM